MPVIQFENLDQYGIITDVPSTELPPGAWSAGQNVEFRNNRVQKLTGYEDASGTLPNLRTGNTVAPTPFWLLPWRDVSNSYVIFADQDNLYRTDGTTEVNVSKSADAYTAGAYPHWSGGIFGGVPVVNNDGLTDKPQSWDSGSSKFQDLPNWPINGSPSSGSPDWETKIIRTYKNFLIALYMVEDIGAGGVQYPTRLRWSDAADPGTVPTVWLPAATNLAGDKSFSGTTDQLVDGLALGDAFVVYKEDSTHIMQFTGGVQVFNFRQAFSEFGLLAPNCVASFFHKHFVVTRTDIVLHDGQRADSILSKRLRKEIFDSIDPTNFVNSFVVANYPKEEMIFCFPPTGSSYPTLMYIWNWQSNTWSKRDIGKVAFMAHSDDIYETGATNPFYDSDTRVYDDTAVVYDGSEASPLDQTFYLVNDQEKIYRYEKTFAYDGMGYAAYVERTGLALVQGQGGKAVVDTRSLKFLRRVHIRAVGATFRVRVGYQDTPDGAVTYLYKLSFTPGTDDYIDCRVQGRILAIRFETITQGESWAIYSYSLDLDVIGTQ